MNVSRQYELPSSAKKRVTGYFHTCDNLGCTEVKKKGYTQTKEQTTKIADLHITLGELYYI